MMRQLEIVGEALKNTTQHFKLNHQDVPWREIIGMRNIIVHDYDNVNIEIIWDTLISDVPNLNRQIKRILSEIR